MWGFRVWFIGLGALFLAWTMARYGDICEDMCASLGLFRSIELANWIQFGPEDHKTWQDNLELAARSCRNKCLAQRSKSRSTKRILLCSLAR